ncbi:MAG: CHAD domain-containing protein [Acetobacteraceae bacterium]
MPTLEFCLPPEDAAALLRLPLLPRRSPRPAAADRVWHDTAGGALAAASLSLYEQKGVWRLERAHPVPGELWPPGTPAPLLGQGTDPVALVLEHGHALPGPLMPLAGFHGRQRVLTLPGDEDEPVTLTLLEGALRGVTREKPVCRLMLDGPAPLLLTLSTTLAQSVRLSAPRWSLACEALALARGYAPPARHTGAPEVPPGATLADAVALVLGHLADVILAGAPSAAEGHTPEPVHQMRVAVRRLRSALSVFRRAADGPALQALGPALKHLGAVLGPARDWDVFLGGTGRAVGEALAEDKRVGAMLVAGARRRNLAYAELKRMLEGPVFLQLEVALVQVAALRPWEAGADEEQAARLEGPAADYATKLLERRLEQMLSPGPDITHLPIEDLHTLRKEGKRLRYAAEFFSPLYGRRSTKRFIERLAVLQEALGHLNDTAAASALMAGLGGGSDRAFAAGVVHGFIAAGIGNVRGEIERSWTKFRKQEPFWT